MTSTSLRVEDKFNGSSNFLSWKTRVTLVLKEYDLWELVDKEVVQLTDLTALVAHEKKEIKVGGQESRGGILRGESIDRKFEDIWFSSLHPCVSGEEDKDGVFGTEGYIFGV